jgi:hypothetical protein
MFNVKNKCLEEKGKLKVNTKIPENKTKNLVNIFRTKTGHPNKKLGNPKKCSILFCLDSRFFVLIAEIFVWISKT